MSRSDRIEQLRAEARHARRRCELYRARAYAQRPTTLHRLRELERVQEAAAARLGAAERELLADSPAPPGGTRTPRAEHDGE